MRVLLTAILFSVSLSAADAPSIALLVNEPAIDATQLADALQSTDALTRATAARVAMVRGIDAALPQLRTTIATESNADAAREEIRALVLLGTDDDVALAAKQLRRFPASIDADFAEAIARVGVPRATSLYLHYAPSLRRAEFDATLALWRRTSLATATAARFLGANDADAFAAVLRAASAGEVPLDAGVISAALACTNAQICEETLWYIVAESIAAPDDAMKDREGERAQIAFARELLRRRGGAERHERADVIEWLKGSEGRARVNGDAMKKLMTANEIAAAADPQHLPMFTLPSGESQKIEMHLPLALPAGLADAIVKKTGCRLGWATVATTAVDRAGRVQSVELPKNALQAKCAAAVPAMMRLSLAQPASPSSALTSARAVVQARDAPLCADEEPVVEAGAAGLHRLGAHVAVPKAIRRAEPWFPESVRKSLHGIVYVTTEAVITKDGCVRDPQLLRQSPYPELNAQALLALSKWKFTPALLDGQPVDVLFTLTISFRTN
ncbi:MAG TPA: energy transducer TonB [Thermoanaerobaculia bacterium]|nr:energy transducer TonB [Thermoanaerobaculia bacterium]